MNVSLIVLYAHIISFFVNYVLVTENKGSSHTYIRAMQEDMCNFISEVMDRG